MLRGCLLSLSNLSPRPSRYASQEDDTIEASGAEFIPSGAVDASSALDGYGDDTAAGLAARLHRQLRGFNGDHGASAAAHAQQDTPLQPLQRAIGEGATRLATFASPIFVPTSAFMKPIWAVYGAFDIEDLATAPFGTSALMWLYLLISSVILVNLLVAMFSDTYSRVLEQSEEEFRYQRYQRMYTAQNVWAPIPPPFSLPSNALKLLRTLCRPLRRCLSGGGSKSRAVGVHSGLAACEENKRRAPAEAKRLQQRYLEKSDRDLSGTVDAKTSSLQSSLQEIGAKQEQQFILLTEQVKGLAEELRAQKQLLHSVQKDMGQSSAPAASAPAAESSAATWEATKPPAEPMEMPEAEAAAVVPPSAIRSGSSNAGPKRPSFLTSTLRSLSPRRSPHS